MSLKVYISGKITGDPDYRGKFSTAESRLKEAGHIVLNPANSPAGMRPADYMRLCLAMMETADIVLFLKDWNNSEGAKLEMAWCRYVRKPTTFDIESLFLEAAT